MLDEDCIIIDNCDSSLLLGDEGTEKIERYEMHFSKGETLMKQGTIAPHVMFVKKGMIKIFLEHRERRQVLCIERESFIGVESLYNDKFFQYSVSAVDDVKVCVMEIESFKRALETNAKFAAAIIKNVNIRLKHQYKRIITLTQKQAAGRVADIFLCMVERIFNKEEFTLPFSKKEFAEMATLSVESLSRILKDFTKENIIEVQGRSIKILDIEKIHKISELG